MSLHAAIQNREKAQAIYGPSCDRRRRLAHALCLSNDMLTAAYGGDWTLVEQLDEERRQLLTDDVFEAGAEETPLIAEAISALVQVNQDITELAMQRKAAIQNQHGDAIVLQQANRSYDAVAAVR